LRGVRGAALPGQSWVVYDPDLGVVIDVIVCEDGRTQERALMGPLLAAAKPGDLWLADRNFCTRAILSRWHQQASAFVVREHGCNPNPRELDKPRKVGQGDTGVVLEQMLSIHDAAGGPIVLRCIELRLHKPTEDGSPIIRLLSNLPAAEFSALELARRYRRHWKIELRFQRLELVLQSEIPAPRHPRAALFAFGAAIPAYNVPALITRAIAVQHRLDSEKLKVSSCYLANQIEGRCRGMMLIVAQSVWDAYAQSSVQCTRIRTAFATPCGACRAASATPTSARPESTCKERVRIAKLGPTTCRYFSCPQKRQD